MAPPKPARATRVMDSITLAYVAALPPPCSGGIDLEVSIFRGGRVGVKVVGVRCGRGVVAECAKVLDGYGARYYLASQTTSQKFNHFTMGQISRVLFQVKQ